MTALVFCAALAGPAPGLEAAPPAWGVLFVLTDDHRHDHLGCAGRPYFLCDATAGYHGSYRSEGPPHGVLVDTYRQLIARSYRENVVIGEIECCQNREIALTQGTRGTYPFAVMLQRDFETYEPPRLSVSDVCPLFPNPPAGRPGGGGGTGEPGDPGGETGDPGGPQFGAADRFPQPLQLAAALR